MKLGEGAQRARACAHKGKRRSAKRRRRRKEEEQGGEGWGELGDRAGLRALGPACDDRLSPAPPTRVQQYTAGHAVAVARSLPSRLLRDASMRAESMHAHAESKTWHDCCAIISAFTWQKMTAVLHTVLPNVKCIRKPGMPDYGHLCDPFS